MAGEMGTATLRAKGQASTSDWASVPEAGPGLFQVRPEPHRRHAPGQAGAVVSLDRDAGERALAQGRLHADPRRLLEEAADRFLLLHPEHGIVVAAHARIGHIG